VSADGGADKIDCGPGNDTAFVDAVDTTKNCEHKLSHDNRRRGLFFGSNASDAFVSDADDHDNRHFDEDETLFLKGGNDQSSAEDGDDTIYLGAGADKTLAGDDDKDGDDVVIDDDGQNGDTIGTGKGQDTVFAADGAAGVIDCGDDRDDTAFIDRADDTINCEHVFSS